MLCVNAVCLGCSSYEHGKLVVCAACHRTVRGWKQCKAQSRTAPHLNALQVPLLQLVIGYLLPSFLVLLLELRSRHAFLRQRQRWHAMRLAQQGLGSLQVPQPPG
jgi:hypothetical protein